MLERTNFTSPVMPPDDVGMLIDRGEAADSVIYARNLLICGAILTVFGLTMLYSTSFETAGLKYFKNQIIWVVIGLFCGGAAYALGYKLLAKLSYVWMGLSVVLLIAALFFPAVNGAHRWIRVTLPVMGAMSLQPSELAKIALALFTASYCAENLRSINNWRGPGSLPKLLGMTGIVIGGILAGRDFGTTVLAMTMVVCIAFAAGLYLRYLLIPLGLVGVMGLYIVLFNPVRLARITTFLRPEEFARTKGYQLFNSQLALGSGGWFGQGFMGSRLKAKYLPECHTDFILAIVGEELGYVALILLLIGYGLFVYYGIKISANSNHRLGMLLGFGLSCCIGFQAAINLAVIAGAAPTKGMPAPFISYGGSNILMCFVALGLLLSIAGETARPDYNAALLAKLKLR